MPTQGFDRLGPLIRPHYLEHPELEFSGSRSLKEMDMKNSRFSEAQIIGVLREQEAA
jgi:hypothetical protein